MLQTVMARVHGSTPRSQGLELNLAGSTVRQINAAIYYATVALPMAPCQGSTT